MSRKSIFINGKFLTLDKRARFQALAVEDGVITDSGTNVKIKPLSKRGFKVYDVKKRFVIPAITDSHLHLLTVGNLFKRINLDGVDSLDKVASALKKAASNLKEGQWLQGRGWNKNLWGGDLPNKNLLDKITGNPVALYSKDGHLLWVNSSALRACGIDKETEDPPGGCIERDADGDLTGILTENAVALVFEKIPPQSYEEKMEAILAAQRHLLKLGVIGIGDCETRPTLISKFHELERDGRLHLRIFKMIDPDDLDRARKFEYRTGIGSEHFRIGCLKLYADGALGSQTALMFKPYECSENNYGVEASTPDEMEEFVSKALDAGISVAIHAIGDRANHQSLKVICKYAKRFAEKGLRPRVEHAQLLRKSEISLFKKFKITASVQPTHATSDRDIADRYWGARARYAFPFKSLLKSGADLAFGSDAPIETADPFAGIHAAVTRKRTTESRNAWYPGERITVRQALAAYTLGSARACCFDDITGSLTVGKRADFAVLSDNILKAKPEDIHKIKAVATIVDGRIVHGRSVLLG